MAATEALLRNNGCQRPSAAGGARVARRGPSTLRRLRPAIPRGHLRHGLEPRGIALLPGAEGDRSESTPYSVSPAWLSAPLAQDVRDPLAGDTERVSHRLQSHPRFARLCHRSAELGASGLGPRFSVSLTAGCSPEALLGNHLGGFGEIAAGGSPRRNVP